MKFRFRLEKMLTFIRLKETTKKMEVASSVQKLNFLRRKRESLMDGIRGILEGSYGEGYLNLNSIVFISEKVATDKFEGEAIDKSIREEEDVLKKRRSELSRLSMRKKGLESLKERKLSEFKLESTRKEQKILDESFELLRARKS